MKEFFKSRIFKIICAFVAVLLVGMIAAAANGTGESAQSNIFGTIFAPIQSAGTSVGKKLAEISGNISGKNSYEKEIDELNKEIEELRSQLVDYENVKRQNSLYKEFLELKEEKKEYTFAECSVTARDGNDLFYSFSIGKGSSSGIEVGDPVIYGKYLVGVVAQVYPTYSVVKTVLDETFNAGVYEIVSKESGYVSGSLDLAKDGLTRMKGLTSNTSVTEGSIICTSGIGGVFPADLIIGKVKTVESEKTDISSYAVLEPGVDVRELSSVFVITDTGAQGNGGAQQ